MSQITWVSLTLLSCLTFPSLAQTTTSQTGSIEANVQGNNNQLYQTIHQTIINHPGKGSINRNPGNYPKRPEKSSRSSSHRHSETIGHPRNHRR
ncbi:hypothetical protein [Crocosphaera sp.]|uniref:hypothetical protein n=1 Tax=Crocosphaera sp. TaxID=2729996 RepID=UPI003F2067C0|nr:hypothetical protein [Crocosphaera sp.]